MKKGERERGSRGGVEGKAVKQSGPKEPGERNNTPPDTLTRQVRHNEIKTARRLAREGGASKGRNP